MKVKDVERTANVAWSPKGQSDILLAAGTAAQQLDASFNTSASLEIYSLNLTEPGPDMVLTSATPSEHRFHKIIWGPYGGEQNLGTIIGGCDGGLLQIYSASKLLKGESGLICRQEKHTGPVHALDFNPFQQNLFATGAGDSEIFIWDMNNTNNPMTPGTKSQPSEDVLSIAWNRQVQHILASTFASKCVIWDLRKNEPIIKLTDTVSRVRWKNVAWHPEVATQLCLASEEDHSPIIQLWDLRFATSPLKTLENHQRGVLSVAWCAEDPDLLVSCGKDNRILAWNPNSNEQNGEILSEIAKTSQWIFDIQWCPRNPAIIACPSFDGHVSVYSLMGGKTQQIQTTNKIADSFPGMEGYVQAPIAQQNCSAPVSVDLSKPPKWLKRPVGASFGFGGKLISFEDVKVHPTQPGQAPLRVARSVQISQVVTEPLLVQKSAQLEQALEYGNFIEYCRDKADAADNQHKKYIWHFLKANFHQNPRVEILNLLGYQIEDVNSKLERYIKKDVNYLADDLSKLNYHDNNVDPFDNLVRRISEGKPVAPFKIKTGDDTEGLLTQALLLGNVEAAVELCLQSKRYADAIIIAMTGGSDLLARTQHAYLDQCEGYVSSLISALVSEDWASVINNCDLDSWKEALAAALTHSTDEILPILCEQLGERLESESRSNLKFKEDSQLCYICSGSFDKLVSSWSGGAQNSVDDLQELIELVMFLQKSIERQGRQIQISGGLADLLSRYASLLASQGHLSTALSYLGASKNEKVANLRERLHISLGNKSGYVQGRQQQQQQSQSRRGSTRHSFTNYPSNVPASAPNVFNPGLANIPATVNSNVNSQPWQNPGYSQPGRVFSPAPPSQPPRAPSAGPPQSGGGGLPPRKHLVDPSIASTDQFGRTPYQAAPNFYKAPDAFSGSYVPNPALNPVPLMPNVGEIAQPALERPQSQYLPHQSAPGWNDPPVFNRPLRNQPKSETPPPPITHPMFGSAPAQPSLPTANNGFGDPVNPPYGQYGQDNGQMFQPPPVLNNNYGQGVAPPTFNPGGFKQNATTPGFNNQQQGGMGHPPAVAHREPPQPVQKAPIPEEHVHMKTVLDELRNQCSNTANNPQTKRKLEDVGRKLEALYDLLRDHKLSPNTLASLHQMVQVVQEGNYTLGLSLHTQLVSGPDFAQIASFMPGLKVLLQCALQLQVYIR